MVCGQDDIVKKNKIKKDIFEAGIFGKKKTAFNYNFTICLNPAFDSYMSLGFIISSVCRQPQTSAVT